MQCALQFPPVRRWISSHFLGLFSPAHAVPRGYSEQGVLKGFRLKAYLTIMALGLGSRRLAQATPRTNQERTVTCS